MDLSENEYNITPQFTVGAVISQSFQVLFKNPLPFFGLTLISLIIGIVISQLSRLMFGNSPLASFISLLVTISITQITNGTISYAVFQGCIRLPISFGKSMSRVISCFASLIIVALVDFVCVVLGMILLLVPGIIAACVLSVAVPACVIERKGIASAIYRSSYLTKGHRLQIFGVFSLATFIMLIFILIATFIAVHIRHIHLPLAILFLCAMYILPMAFFNVIPAVLYYNLRTAKEGVAMESLSGVFD
ncbi:MAG: hypothetical protein LBQ58_02670 [Synergistaceae bacterium]|jgi:hypothetical protein|nr:hypothetical protein [Synergistaceae bacterium]